MTQHNPIPEVNEFSYSQLPKSWKSEIDAHRRKIIKNIIMFDSKPYKSFKLNLQASNGKDEWFLDGRGYESIKGVYHLLATSFSKQEIEFIVREGEGFGVMLDGSIRTEILDYLEQRNERAKEYSRQQKQNGFMKSPA
jgi:hypothetical protein